MMTIFNAESDGLFKGQYVQLGNVDLGGDIILKGAFNEWCQNIDANARAYFWQHDWDKPLAKLYPCMKTIAFGIEGELLLIFKSTRGAYMKPKITRLMA